jgi:hypothetical protein
MRNPTAGILAVLGLAAFGLAAAGGAWAHHPESGLFDERNEVTLTAVIRSIVYQAPHVMLQVERTPGGEAFTVFLPAPLELETHGLPKGTLQVGKTIRVTGSPGVNDPSVLKPEHLEIGGVAYDFGHESAAAGTPAGAPRPGK